ncbi:hypothetical protein FKM82_010622 [Ascaphus truei]
MESVVDSSGETEQLFFVLCRSQTYGILLTISKHKMCLSKLAQTAKEFNQCVADLLYFLLPSCCNGLLRSE